MLKFCICLFVLFLSLSAIEIELERDVQKVLAEEDSIIHRLREYLKIDTRQPNPNYAPAIEYLVGIAKDMDLEYEVIEFVAEKPILIMKWEGEKTEKKGIMLYSHIDVVNVDNRHWDSDPFAAEIRDGKIYARGSQDMKSVGMGYLEAIRILHARGYKPERNFFIIFAPDEEIGGETGAELLSQSEEWKKLNIGVGLDEGGPNEKENEYLLFRGERDSWWFKIIATGPEGHASGFLLDTATEKLSKIIPKIFEFRAQEKEKMIKENKRIGEVASINISMMKADKNGSLNVVPGEAIIGMDLRIPPTYNLQDIYDRIQSWFSHIPGVRLEFVQGGDPKYDNPLSSDDHPFYKTIVNTFDNLDLKVDSTIFQAATDARFFRKAGIPVYGISMIDNTPWLLHDHNEYLPVNVYMKGINIYCNLIMALDKTETE